MIASRSEVRVVVLDASVTLTWLFEDEACEYGDGLAQELPSLQAVVPDLWHLEIANAICVGERRKRVTQLQSQAFLADLRGLPITSERRPRADVWEHTLPLARLYQLTSYDAGVIAPFQRIKLRQRDRNGDTPHKCLNSPLIPLRDATSRPAPKRR